jgi:prevent-host-death family protein
MEKTVGAFEVRRQFGRILQEVTARGDRFVVERHGQAVAVVVPIEVYEQWKRARAAFFATLRATAEQANLALEDGEKLAEEAVRGVRAGS